MATDELTLLRELARETEALHREVAVGDPRRWRRIEAGLAAWHALEEPGTPMETTEARLHARRWEVLGIVEEALEGFRSGRLGPQSAPMVEWMRTAATLVNFVQGR